MPKATLLFVDNDPDFTEIRAQILTVHGYKVCTASKPAQIKAVLEREKIDLVILDVRLSNDGFVQDKGGLILANEMDSSIPKIILTSSPTLALVREALAHIGKAPLADDFVAKEEGPEALLASIDDVLQRRGVMNS